MAEKRTGHGVSPLNAEIRPPHITKDTNLDVEAQELEKQYWEWDLGFDCLKASK